MDARNWRLDNLETEGRINSTGLKRKKINEMIVFYVLIDFCLVQLLSEKMGPDTRTHSQTLCREKSLIGIWFLP